MNRRIKLNRILTIALPVVLLIVALVTTYMQFNRLRAAREDLEVAQKDLTFQRQMLEDLGSTPLAAKQPAVPADPGEQALFLEGLRQIARANGVSLVKWSNIVPAANPDPNAPKPLPGDPVPVASTLEVVGPYPAVRKFLYDIQEAPRLLNYTNVKFSRDSSETQMTRLTLTLTRYLTAGGASALAASPTHEG